MKPLIAAVFAVALGGCQGVEYAMNEYQGVPVTHFVDKPTSGRMVDEEGRPIATTYRIFDKPEQNKLMITPSVGDSMGMGAMKGLTFGAGGNASPAALQAAAMKWLQSKGRTCTATQTILVVEPQYEVKYICGATPPAATAPPKPA